LVIKASKQSKKSFAPTGMLLVFCPRADRLAEQFRLPSESSDAAMHIVDNPAENRWLAGVGGIA
jgi:hypothetical protein